MTKTKFQDGITNARVAWFGCMVLLTVPLVAGLATMIGCQDASTERVVADQVTVEDPPIQDVATAEQEPVQDQDQGVLGKAGDLLKKATAKGGEKAMGAGQWVQEKLSGAADAGEQSAEESWKWANETYEMLKSQGLTTASNTSQWLGQDWNNMESWKYKVVTLGGTDEGLTKTLNELGKQGWECFETETNAGGTRFYFKKPTFSYLRQLPFKDMIKLVPMMNNGE